ncbi:glutathione S-transferase N-terminal domain-containing protein [Alkanindiges sp. WGS2144]|uniref:glutathione S-transferase N-terminal domain-containing protein n=1 Tax=Alkanindiges sp. WGS2144 TaxID=3366808 RepID=UPI0037526EB7
MILHQAKVLRSVVATLLEGSRGVMGTPNPKQPAKPIRLYDFEASPFCRRVREVLTLLNLDVEVYPCPKKGTRFRPQVKELAGKTQFPFLVDENTGVKLLESQDIINYLFKTYGKTGTTPKKYQNLPKIPVRGLLVTLAGGIRGLIAAPGNAQKVVPDQLLELWSFEGSPYSRLVRERLSELELPYILHNVAKERWQDMGPAKLRLKPGKYEPIQGGKRASVLAEQGRVQVPYLVDPNTGVSLYESADILAYLNKTYA